MSGYDQHFNDEIKAFNKKYQEIVKWWDAAKVEVIKHHTEISEDVKSYKAPLEVENNEVQFEIFSTKCFIRFSPIYKKNDYPDGVIEYGTINKDDKTGLYERNMVDCVQFDCNGNVKEPDHAPYTVRSFRHMHSYMISEKIIKYIEEESCMVFNDGHSCMIENAIAEAIAHKSFD
ncbi:MAG: hypothetical protein PVI90_01595 [Desulfobacteraceae bacterium]